MGGQRWRYPRGGPEHVFSSQRRNVGPRCAAPGDGGARPRGHTGHVRRRCRDFHRRSAAHAQQSADPAWPDQIRAFLSDVFSRDISHHVDHIVSGNGTVSFMERCEYPTARGCLARRSSMLTRAASSGRKKYRPGTRAGQIPCTGTSRGRTRCAPSRRAGWSLFTRRPGTSGGWCYRPVGDGRSMYGRSSAPSCARRHTPGTDLRTAADPACRRDDVRRRTGPGRTVPPGHDAWVIGDETACCSTGQRLPTTRADSCRRTGSSRPASAVAVYVHSGPFLRIEDRRGLPQAGRVSTGRRRPESASRWCSWRRRRQVQRRGHHLPGLPARPAAFRQDRSLSSGQCLEMSVRNGPADRVLTRTGARTRARRPW